MKFRHLSVLLMYILFAQHSCEQGIESNYLGIPSSSNGATYENAASISDAAAGSNGAAVGGSGLAGVLRNRTNSLLQRLEGPRDRVLEFIRPAVKSDFSRNVTNVLNTIWSRVQHTNSSIMHNPLFRNSVIIPINTTLSRLKQITAADNDNMGLDDTNLEIINLNKPEDEAHLREYLRPASSAVEAATNAPVIFLFREERDEKERTASASDNVEATEVPSPPVDQSNSDQNNSTKSVKKAKRAL